MTDVAYIDELGWQLHGNIASLNFELYDEDGDVVAVVGKKYISVKDKYAVDINQLAYEQEVVAILLALQHALRDRGKGSKPSDIVGNILFK